MAINFAAASTAGLNNPGTEIITLVKDVSGNFINPPSYDKMRGYLRSGEVPCLFVTDAAGTTGDIYQLSGYSETDNKIRFAGEKTAIEFSAGSDVPVETEIGGGGGGLSYDVIVTSADGGTNFALYAGSYEAAKNKILNKECVTVSIYIDATAEAPIQIYKNFSVFYSADPELIVINYMTMGGGFVQLHLKTDNTVTKA